MDFRRERLIDGQIGSSWIPITPSKPGLTEQQPICENQPFWLQSAREKQANWLEQESFLPEFLGESPSQGIAACFEDWKVALTTQSQAQGSGFGIYSDKFSCAELLAMADASASSQANYFPLSGETRCQTTSFADTQFRNRSNFQTNDNAAGFRQYDHSTPVRHSVDLNSPLETFTVRTISSAQFAPLTPDQAKRDGQKQVPNITNFCVNRTNEASDNQEKEVVVVLTDEENHPHHDNERSCAAAAACTEWHESHNPDKEGNQVSELNETPPQKPRRRKHRPKVVLEGQSRRTRKPETPSPALPKRKYVRKNGVEKHTATPSVEVTSGTSIPRRVGRPRKSCRKSLNFDLENEAMREEGFSCKETLNLTTESYAQNFNSQTQTRTFVQLGKRMEVITEKTQLGTAYDLCRSTNQLLENYLSMPERQVPSPATPAKNDPPCEKLMSKDQNECKRGKCRIFFSDKTHDKEGNAVQGIVNVGVQSALKSLDYSYCSSTRCFSKEEQTNGLKRKHMCTSEEAEFCIVNGATTNHNPLQEYLAKYPVNGCKIDQSGAHFPVIYKKKRTKKEQSIASSCASLSMATENRGGQQLTYTPKEQYPNNFSIETACRVSAAQFSNDSCRIKKTGAQDKQGLFNCMLALGNADRLTKKRSKAPSCVRDFNSRVGVLERLPAFPTRGPSSALIQGSEISHHYSSCLEALAAGTRTTMAKRKRTKRKSLVTSVPPNMYNQHMFLPKPIGLLQNKTWKGMADADILVEQFKRLAIGGESTQLANEEQNAVVPYCMRYQDHYDLVLYKRDGTIVPFEGSFDPVKKRRPRPKVDLDPETSRVWKLLLENINNTGIDGTDEEKTKWWEEERSVFRGRADSFIARMHLVQGDRRFSRWKGSVVDSVIGVFLTQNVSDHLSSSAFMSLAARFPLKSEVNQRQPTGDSKCIVEEPDVQVEDPVDSIQWHESNHQPICYQNSITLKEKEIDDEKVDISNASSRGSIIEIGLTDHSKIRSSDYHDICQGMHNESAANESEIVASSAGDQRDMDGTSSSQNSVVSSHNSLDPLSVVSCSWSKSEVELDAVHANNFGDCTSFMELLLQKAGTTALYGIHEQLCGNMPLDKQDQLNQSAHMVSNSLEDNKKGTDEPRNFMGTTSPLDNYHVHLRPNLGEDVLKFFDASADESRISDVLERDDENSSIEQSGLTSDSASQTSVQHIMVVSSQEASRSPSENNYPFINIQSEKDKIVQSQMTVEDPKKIDVSQTQENQCKMQEVLTAPTFSGNTLWNTDTISDIGNSTKGKQKAVEEKLNSNQLSTKIGRSGKGKQSAVDWDNLRKQAQPNGEKRERTVNTMDSLDYEALRCADVNEIADTIKERGMNNVLAERIKAFLNRTVEEHGSIDLEWLRDVPPDKAKEYLLSINGLGLKSVECVRLLTLHHLAFPVDTNVGRIAVRLGWVPLQPLPESLQLHLLELYPVLETIQKYLWPRLCKLDQRTLYELHYQMITFGKVFCTKSKPNCNACPMRGECRHFASAFASARLALPSPEEKSLVSATGNEGANRQSMDINLLQLPEPQANQHLKIHSGVRDIGPIIEVPASPEPVIEVPLTPEPEIIQPRENDIEDTPCEDPDEIPIIKLNMEEFAQTLEQHMKQNMELQEGEMSKALVALTPEAASIPMPKLKNVSRLRTEHQVYELPDSHPLLEGLDKREPDDPCSYLLAIWTPGETADSIQPPESRCASQEFGYPCDDTTCFSCSSTREAYSQTVRGTLLIPCRTAMRGSFPLNGTYFQVNEVFADHESSLNPISVPRAWIWNLPRRTVYFGTSIPTIFKGLSTEDIQYCFWRGFVCVRGFDQKARAPRPLMARLHFPASKLTKTVGKTN